MKLPKGVFQKKGRTTYYSMFQRGTGKIVYLGSYDTPESAKKIYDAFKQRVDSGEIDFNELVKQNNKISKTKRLVKQLATKIKDYEKQVK